MKKRLLAALLAFCMTVSLFPMQAMAAAAGNTSALGSLGIRQISSTAYSISPDVREYEWVLNNGALTQQMMGHVMEVQVGGGSTASIAVGYGDDDIETIKTGRNWAMTETTKQAQSMQTRRETNVVGAINAGGYDMSNGRPSGAFIMSGTQINAPTGTTFWIDKSGDAHITDAQKCNAALAEGNVREAVASFGDIFENGHARSGLDNVTRASRTAIGIKADGSVVMFMVDGRQAPYSVGMTMAEVAAAMEELGCVQAINLDGGGSSTFATQREGEPENSTSAGLALRCRPSDGYERKVSNTIMVLSTAEPTGQFDHAVLTPNDEVYTPGSTVQFTAKGVDAAGGEADIPAGASWAVLSGGGSIDANGLYTAADTCGTVTVGLKVGGQTVGQTSIQVQWPDKLGFTNTSVSIDFGKTSDLTFKPTWQGREVKYKDGDFEWNIAPNYYKFNALVDPKTNNTKGDFSMAITPDTLEKNTVVVEYYAWGTSLTYTSTYRVTELTTSTTDDGTLSVTAKVAYVSSGGAIGEKKPAELEQTFTAGIGKMSGNLFIADANNSLRGTITATLKGNSNVSGSVDVAVGMDPFVLMDFEDYNIRKADGSVETIPARQYWSTHVGSSVAVGSDGTRLNGQLLPEEVKENRLWIRDTTGKGVIFPEGYNRIVSAEEDENVRFGQYAFKLGYDFTNVTAASTVAAADFGFSGDLLVNTMQPTRIGLWINVPKDSAGDTSILKAVLKGAAFEANLDTAYMKLNADGSVSYVDGKQLTGTAAYVQYYSYNADGTVSGSTLSDWAGKGWTWVEADISAFQMPVDVCRAYTVRVTSPQNCTKNTGYLYIDNLQFIYGTNTNDVTRPVLESVTETSSGAVLAGDGSTVLESGNLTFAAVYSDSELTDKYATGIDTSGIRVLLDGTDYTGKLEINDGSLYLKGVALRNGTHTLTIRLKDFYGNVTTETRTFRVEDAKGMQSAIDILPQPEPPEIGKEYVFAIVNNTGETVTEAELTVDFRAMGNAAEYLAGAEVESRSSSDYTLKLDQNALAKGLAKITVTKSQAPQARRAMRTGVQDTDYNYVSELGYLIITIPENAASDSKLKCTVTQGSYTVADGTETGTAYTFSGTEKVVPMTASYQLTCEQAIARMPAELTVTDADGKPISRADIYQVSSDSSQKLGSTNMRGVLTHTFDTAGEYTFYAKKTGGGRSWNQRVIVCERTAENDGKPFGILTNGVTKAGTKSITWLTQIDGSKAEAQVKYSTDAALTDAATVNGTSAIQTFVQSTRGDALRSNKVTLTDLTPDTTYYYRVGDGTTWSDTQSFKTPAADAEATNFFILGDIQTSNTANLAAALEKLRAGSYDFGVQTGDAIDNVTMYETHCRPFLNTVNSDTLGGVDLIHVLGNHEYYGDADGKISKAIYDLPESAQNSWYKMEYGKVCVVVVNHGTKLAETLADIAENLTTDCIWKVLVAHEPIYGTESVSATPEILASIEKAGFDFVFGGDDHAYARTYPMIGGEKQAENSRNGVVYFVCGDLSGKNNEFHDREVYAKAIPHNDNSGYSGMYLTVNATEESFTVKAIDVNNGKELDTYTETRTDCELGRHKVDSTSKYDMTANTITCAVCGEALQPEGKYAFSGLLGTTDGKQVILASGSVKKNEFSSQGEDRYHSCANGYAYLTMQSDSRTCVTAGYITYTCPICKQTNRSDVQRPVDHKWDATHVCTVCHTQGIDINSPDIVFKFGSPENPRESDKDPNFYYTGSGVRPGSFAKHGDYVLTQNNDANLINNKIPDLYVEWPDSKNVGKAEIKCEGRGNYYGVRTLTYYIVPNDVKDLKCTSATINSLTLSWSAAPGAEYYEVFKCDKTNGSRTSLGTTADTTLTVTGLSADTEYYFVAAGRTKVPTENNKVYSSAKWSNILCATTNPLSADVTAMSTTVDGVQIPAVNVKGTNYLFLPASANLTNLAVTFTRSADIGNLVVIGNQGSQTVTGAAVLNVPALASETDGYRVLTAKVGNGAAFTVRIMQASELPTIYLTSTDASAQGRGYVDADKQHTTTAALKMIGANGSELSTMTVKELKARGNSTFAHYPKKAYQIKLSAASDLLGTGEQVKTWVLLANYGDATMMHDQFFKELAAEMGMDYVASTGWVNLYYDGEYRGVYLLTEKNHIGTDATNITDLEAAYEDANEGYGENMTTATGVNRFGQAIAYTEDLTDPADITGGYMIELNHQMWDEVSGFKTAQGVAFNVKSPEWLSEDAVRYISEYYQEFENAVYAADKSGYNAETRLYYYDYVDADSLVKMFVLQELGLNPDGFVSSLYFYKDVNGKMYVGPIWDQDMTLGTGWTKYLAPDQNYTYHYLAEALIQIPDFQERVRNYYAEFAAKVEKMENRIDDKLDTLTDSAAMNYILWDLIRVGDPQASGHIWNNVNYTDTVRDMKRWITTRMATLEKALAGSSYDSGDANMDGVLDAFDAVDILRYLAGYDNDSFSSQYADFNGDGKVDAFDAVDILRYLAGYRD